MEETERALTFLEPTLCQVLGWTHETHSLAEVLPKGISLRMVEGVFFGEDMFVRMFVTEVSLTYNELYIFKVTTG